MNNRRNNLKEELASKKNEKNQERHNGFIDKIKVDTKAVNSVIEKRKFLEEINGNKEALSMLSIDSLKKLEKYYDSVIEKMKKQLKN